MNLRNRNALQLIDHFEKNNDVIIRLTALYQDSSSTHIGISLDPPYQDWNISDVSIVDDKGRSYWFSITRGTKEDPFFPVRVITDPLSDDIKELMISICRIYYPDKEAEKKVQQSIKNEEKEVYNKIPGLGSEEPVSAEIREINTRLRELERRRFFHLPIVKKEIKGRWSFAIPVDHSLQNKVDEVFQLKTHICLGNTIISPILFKRGIIRNELICHYDNPILLKEVLAKASTCDDEDLIFSDHPFSPIPPCISLFDGDSMVEYSPKKETDSGCSSFNLPGCIFLSKSNQLMLYYWFKPFESTWDKIFFNIYGIESFPQKHLPVMIKDDKETVLQLPIYQGNMNEGFSAHLTMQCSHVHSKNKEEYYDIICSYKEIEEVKSLRITAGFLSDFETKANCTPILISGKTTEDNSNEIRTLYRFLLKEERDSLIWNISAYYYLLQNPLSIKLDLSESADSAYFKETLQGGRIIIPGR